jgi:MFS family permease
VTVVSFVILAAGGSPASIYIAAGLLGVGIGFAFAALANLIVEAVRPDQTGIASGMNTLVRTIGGAIGAEVAASILAANVLASGYPNKHGYTLTFLLCAAVLAVAVVASLLVPGRARSTARASEPAAATE